MLFALPAIAWPDIVVRRQRCVLTNRPRTTLTLLAEGCSGHDWFKVWWRVPQPLETPPPHSQIGNMNTETFQVVGLSVEVANYYTAKDEAFE